MFQALANPTRRLLLMRLADGPASVGELAEPFDMSLAAVSKHLMGLEAAGLVDRTVSGRTTRCRLVVDRLEEARSVIDQYRAFWEKRLDALTEHLEVDG